MEKDVIYKSDPFLTEIYSGIRGKQLIKRSVSEYKEPI